MTIFRNLLCRTVLFIAVLATSSLFAVAEESQGEPLRVGITPDYPPMIAKDGDKVVGMEAEFARRLAKELGRPLYFVENKWELQVPALLKGEVDLIMSGMTITDERKVRIAFSETYLETGLIAMFRGKDATKYDSVDKLKESISNVGYKKGTTAEKYFKANFPNSTGRGYLLPSDAAFDLKRNRLDVFIHDGPAIAWLVSKNESELSALYKLLSRDSLGWGVRHDDKELLEAVNGVLARWKEDGTLGVIVDRWLPYRKNFNK